MEPLEQITDKQPSEDLAADIDKQSIESIAADIGTSKSGIERQLEEVVANSALAKEWRSSPAVHESRRLLKIDPSIAANNVTVGKLAGEDGIHPPFVFFNNAEGSLLAFYRLGEGLAGHQGILHGGISTVLLDECMGRACFPLLAKNIAVTASLEIKFRAPVLIPGVVLLSAKTVLVEGRKAWVEGRIEDPATGVVCVEANALFIEPRGADAMSRMM